MMVYFEYGKRIRAAQQAASKAQKRIGRDKDHE